MNLPGYFKSSIYEDFQTYQLKLMKRGATLWLGVEPLQNKKKKDILVL